MAFVLKFGTNTIVAALGSLAATSWFNPLTGNGYQALFIVLLMGFLAVISLGRWLVGKLTG